jgi:uncharacterized membrane protein
MMKCQHTAGAAMPLSEDEQRILRQIEEQLQRDPRFGRQARAVAGVSSGSPALPLVGVILSVAACVMLLAVSPLLAFGSFLISVVSGGVLWQRCAASARQAWTDSVSQRLPRRN